MGDQPRALTYPIGEASGNSSTWQRVMTDRLDPALPAGFQLVGMYRGCCPLIGAAERRRRATWTPAIVSLRVPPTPPPTGSISMDYATHFERATLHIHNIPTGAVHAVQQVS